MHDTNAAQLIQEIRNLNFTLRQIQDSLQKLVAAQSTSPANH